MNEISVVLKDGTFYTPTDQDYIAWQRAYPDVNVHTEVAAAASWCDANPAKRKINGKRFLVNWLKRAQDRGGSPQARGRSLSTRDMSMEEMFDTSWAR